MIRVLRSSGFEIEDLIEIQVPEDSPSPHGEEIAPPEWVKRYPPEQIWKARKR